MVEEIWNSFAHSFAGKNSYFVVAEDLKRYLSEELSANCIIESKTSITMVIEGHSLGDDWALVGLHYLESMVEVTERSCYLEWSPFN